VTSGENDRRHAPEDVLLLRSKQITHQGETLGFILEGQLEPTIETTTYPLNEGDSFFFKNHLTNGYRNLSSGITRILWVNTPRAH
jgi:uncharacterized cupin superfamily protein